MAVSPLPNVVTSPTQSAAAPHPANLTTVFKEMMNAAETIKTIVPTMDEIESVYKHRWAALIRPASPLLSHPPSRSPVLSDATVNVAQPELQLAKSKMTAFEGKAEQSESEISSVKTLMQGMVHTMQGMQNIMSSNITTAITVDSRKSPEPSHSLSPRSVRSSISRDSSSSEWLGQSQISHKMKRDKHNKSKHHSQSPSSSSSSSSESEPESELMSVCQAVSSSSHGSRSSRNYEHDPRLPNFTGKEAWKVWFTRFDDIATCRGWGKEKQLDVFVDFGKTIKSCCWELEP